MKINYMQAMMIVLLEDTVLEVCRCNIQITENVLPSESFTISFSSTSVFVIIFLQITPRNWSC